MTPGPETYTSTTSNVVYGDELGGHRASAHSETQTATECLKPLFHRLETMSRALAVDAHTDFVEFCLSTHSAPAICVFRKDALQTEHIDSLFQELQLGQHIEDFFWVLLARIPAERHAVRLSLDNKFSVFFKTDVPTGHIGSITEAIGLGKHAEPVVRYFEATGRVPCGIAWELGESRFPRLRLYDNVMDFDGFGNTPPLLPLIPREHLNTLRALCGDHTASPSVLNFSITHEGISVKIEAPGVVPGDLSRPGLQTREHELFTLVHAIMTHYRIPRLNYFGLRFRGKQRDVTCYLDALELQSQIGRAYAATT